MKDKGYVSAGTLSTDQYAVAQFALALQQEEGAFEVFRKYTASRTLRELEGDILGTTANLEYQTLRFQRHLDRLATLKEQVNLCTVRAPHDGYLIYANDARREVFIEEGLPVRQNQKLFYLPDLADMQVIALLSESVVNQVRNRDAPRSRSRDYRITRCTGRVTKVAQLPLPDWRGDVHYFEGIVQLDDPPSSLMPGMTAQVEVEMPGRENVLAVRSEAVTIDDGHDVCFVVHEEGVERREVKLGQVTNEMTEVTAGAPGRRAGRPQPGSRGHRSARRTADVHRRIPGLRPPRVRRRRRRLAPVRPPGGRARRSLGIRSCRSDRMRQPRRRNPRPSHRFRSSDAAPADETIGDVTPVVHLRAACARRRA